MDKLNFMGSGPKIGLVALPWLAVTITLSLIYKNYFVYSETAGSYLFISGLALLFVGMVMYFSTVPLLLRGLKETKLITGGAYYLCCNPLYASLLLLIIPGISLMMNSWIIITTSIAGYIAFKIAIKSEYREMEKFFGNDYKKYRELTPEFFPFPFRKWFR